MFISCLSSGGVGSCKTIERFDEMLVEIHSFDFGAENSSWTQTEQRVRHLSDPTELVVSMGLSRHDDHPLELDVISRGVVA
jgi:hypothetical protein